MGRFHAASRQAGWPEVTERPAGTHKREIQRVAGTISDDNRRLQLALPPDGIVSKALRIGVIQGRNSLFVRSKFLKCRLMRTGGAFRYLRGVPLLAAPMWGTARPDVNRKPNYFAFSTTDRHSPTPRTPPDGNTWVRGPFSSSTRLSTTAARRGSGSAPIAADLAPLPSCAQGGPGAR